VCPSPLRRRLSLAVTAPGGVLACSATDCCQHSLTALALSCLPSQYMQVMEAIDQARHRQPVILVEASMVRLLAMAYQPGSFVPSTTAAAVAMSPHSAIVTSFLIRWPDRPDQPARSGAPMRSGRGAEW